MSDYFKEAYGMSPSTGVQSPHQSFRRVHGSTRLSPGTVGYLRMYGVKGCTPTPDDTVGGYMAEAGRDSSCGAMDSDRPDDHAPAGAGSDTRDDDTGPVHRGSHVAASVPTRLATGSEDFTDAIDTYIRYHPSGGQ